VQLSQYRLMTKMHTIKRPYSGNTITMPRTQVVQATNK
jgi:hypothetical protein